MKIDFIKALQVVRDTVPLVVDISASVLIGAVIIGVIANAVSGGEITVIASIGTFITNFTATIVTMFTSLGAGAQLAISLLAVAVIIVIFRHMLSGKKAKKGTNT